MTHPLLGVDVVDSVESHLSAVGTVFRVFDQQDSGCLSYGVAIGPERWFVKTTQRPSAIRSLRRAMAFHAAVQHPVIIAMRHTLRTASGVPVLVYPWVDGELSGHPACAGRARRRAVGRIRRGGLL